jgi:predicted CXXCH cytochrome family protein
MIRLTTVFFILVSLISYCFGAEKPKVEKPQTEQETCITEECHGDRASKAVVHDPVSEGSCEACHETMDIKEHTYKLIGEEPGICFECHDEFTKKHLHGAFKEGQCSQCHETHTSDNENRLLAGTAGEMCLTCHEVAENAAYVHGPTSVNECTLCHAPHESEHEKRLVMGLDQLCVFCHVTTKEELDSIEFNHEPVRDNCVGCHDPHGADNWEMLKAQTPDMCYSCHEEIQARAQNSKHQHNAVLEEGGCLKCHTPHASSVRPLLASAPTTLCMTCHSKPLGVSVNEVMPAFIGQIKDKAYLHGPIKDGDCGGCHMTHGSDHFRILAAEYPPGFYTSFDEAKYELCFGCHERTLVQNATTDSLTNFRNGNQNLHFAHVNKERRGRTCRACHQTHASNQLKHIRKSVPYGGWKDMPINFTKTETGGLCDPGCHLEVGYDRQTAVDYTVTPSGRTFRPRVKVGSGISIKQIPSGPKE